MKIVYSAGNRLGSDVQLFRFLNALDSSHEIKIAGYVKSTESLNHIDWTLDAITNKLNLSQPHMVSDFFGHKGLPKMVLKQAEILLEEVNDFNPDLIICDGESILAHVAKALSKTLWYCSPLHLLDGIPWERNQLRYMNSLDSLRNFLSSLPKADRTFIYAPYGNLKSSPVLKENYEWVTPYFIKTEKQNEDLAMAVIKDNERAVLLSKILNCVSFKTIIFRDCFAANLSSTDVYKNVLKKCDWFFTNGETSYLADAIYNKIERICIAPNLKDWETILNSILCRNLNIAYDAAQIELMEQFSVSEFEKAFSIKKSNILLNEDYEFLDQKVKEL